MLTEITPLILAFNEAPNIRRTLEKLAWAKEILVVDSFSTDETLDIVKSFPQTRLLQRRFDTFASQCNFGLQQIRSEWVLSLDADYVLSDDLNRELAELRPSPDIAGYRANFTYCIHGHPLRASLYPPRTVLYRKVLAAYRDEGHGHRVEIRGNVIALEHPILHDDRKPLERWLSEQMKYARQEAEYLSSGSGRGAVGGEQGAGSAVLSQERKVESRKQKEGTLNWRDRIRRKIIFAPVLVFLYTLLGKGLILDGWPGWYYVFQRTLAEMILSLHLIERRFGSK